MYIRWTHNGTYDTTQVKQPVGSREISAGCEEVARNGVNPANIPLFAGFNSPRSGIPAEERCYEISVKVDRYPLPGALRDLRKNSYCVLMIQDQRQERYCILYTERAKQYFEW